MKLRVLLAGSIALCGIGTAVADDAFLRLRCEGEAAGAVVSINGVKKGECPIDLVVPEGKVVVKVRQSVDQYRFKTFEKELFLPAGAMKRETVQLGPIQFTPEGQRLEDERIVREKAAAERLAAEQAAAAAALAEQKKREAAARARVGATQDYLYLLKTGVNRAQGRNEREGPLVWTSFLVYAPVSLPLSTLTDLASGKDVFATAADPAAFANPDSMVGRVARVQRAQGQQGAR
jgi:hypothetical protein